jgi:hypothetical protein
MLSNRVDAGVGFAMLAPAEEDMSDCLALRCKLIGGHGIVRCAERQMCSLACQPALPGTPCGTEVTARRTMAMYLLAE